MSSQSTDLPNSWLRRCSASLDLGAASHQHQSSSQARQELEQAQTRSEKLGLRSLQARAEYLLGAVSRLTGSNSLALDHYHDVQRLLDEIRRAIKKAGPLLARPHITSFSLMLHDVPGQRNSARAVGGVVSKIQDRRAPAQAISIEWPRLHSLIHFCTNSSATNTEAGWPEMPSVRRDV